MLFSKDRWSDADEIQPFLQTSSALSYEKVSGPIQRAEDKYLAVILGNDLLAHFIDLYDSSSSTGVAQSVLEKLQGAEANLAYADEFDEFQIRLTDQGIQRQETEKFKQAYRYQEKEMLQKYKNRGLNFLDAAIELLDQHSSDFPLWEESEYRKARKSLVIRNAREVSDVYFINNSSIIYMRLMPIIRTLTDLQLPKVLGKELCAKFLTALKDGLEYIDDEHKALSVEKLRLSCAKWMIFVALAELAQQTGSITDRGLYFSNTKAVNVDPNEDNPGSRGQIQTTVVYLQDKAYGYRNALADIVLTCFPDFFGGHECDVYKRCNYGKKFVML